MWPERSRRAVGMQGILCSGAAGLKLAWWLGRCTPVEVAEGGRKELLPAHAAKLRLEKLDDRKEA